MHAPTSRKYPKRPLLVAQTLKNEDFFEGVFVKFFKGRDTRLLCLYPLTIFLFLQQQKQNHIYHLNCGIFIYLCMQKYNLITICTDLMKLKTEQMS